ncbi:hypothetical protein WD019_21315, partial [Fictibacillus sp. Mic-4]|uniref:hypothetical protein n=1 Tax=Fictibacillus sp. Mic-4 TaxID=3132826 RepID=UPI003CEA6D90
MIVKQNAEIIQIIAQLGKFYRAEQRFIEVAVKKIRAKRLPSLSSNYKREVSSKMSVFLIPWLCLAIGIFKKLTNLKGSLKIFEDLIRPISFPQHYLVNKNILD